MKPSRFSWMSVLCLSALSGVAAAQSVPPVLRDYEVQPGDTCMKIALSQLGNRSGVKQIHANNQLGPVPHVLKPGQILKLPVLAAPPATNQPDAHLTFVRNRVDAYTPERHRGRKDEPLLRGNRVNTLEASSAEITFHDTSQLQLGEDTLVVILGDTRTTTTQRRTAADTTLVQGSLRAHLDELAGATRPVLRLGTAGGHRIGMSPGDAAAHVDETKTTRLAVYRGRSTLALKNKQVVVPSGYGSKAPAGKNPEPPRPLPASPTWVVAPPAVVLLRSNELTAELAAQFAPAAGGPPVAQWHLQVARDSRFNDLLLDTRVPRSIDHLNAQGLTPGTYLVRVSGIDGDRFEGPPGPVAEVTVAVARVVDASPGKRAHVELPPGLWCSVDDAALAEVKGPVDLAPSVPHTVRCATQPAAQPGSGLEISAAEAGRYIVRTRTEAEQGQSNGDLARDVIVEVEDPSGAPAQIAVTAETTAGVTVSAATPIGPGKYRVTSRWSAQRNQASITLLIAGVQRETHTFTPTLQLAPPRLIPHHRRSWAFEPALLFTGVYTQGVLGPGGGFGAELGARFKPPAATGQLALSMRIVYERLSCPLRCAGAVLTENIATFVFPVSYRFRPPEARWNPYVSLQPQVSVASVQAAPPSSQQLTLRRSTVGIGALGGIAVRVGRGHFFLEAGYRHQTEQSLGVATPTLAGGVGYFGYRLSL